IRERILLALDSWFGRDRTAELAAVLRAVDPDPYREAIRAALGSDDGDQLAALAKSPEAYRQPAWFTVLLGRLDEGPVERRRTILQSAQLSRPGSFEIIMTLVNLHEGNVADQERWARIGVAVRPDRAIAWYRLGFSLGQGGDNPGAEACYREAVRLEPT